MDELAKDIAALLKDMARGIAAASKEAQPERVTVYVAETTSDLDDKVGELRRDLKDRGYLVLPSGDLPYRANAYKEKVRDCLRQAVLSVHLVGADYGFVPEGETKSNVWLQHDLAMARGADPAFQRLIWMPGDVRSQDQRQGVFIAHLQEDAGVQKGADLLNGNLEELKTVIHEKLADIRKRQEKSQGGRRRGKWQWRRGGKARAGRAAARLSDVRPGRPQIAVAGGAAEIPAGAGLRTHPADRERG